MHIVGKGTVYDNFFYYKSEILTKEHFVFLEALRNYTKKYTKKFNSA